ncbi:MAG: DUF4293 domain-containing protein [Bacteroidales bacterium]|jgi:hypothetical protein|nr:DUF4293 domain-containing protein [Bacteroidales bacterium]
MIQRIQTLWLTLVLALSVIALFFPILILDIDVKGAVMKYPYFLFPKGEENFFKPAYLLIILQSAVFIITLVSVFLYKKRILQIRMLAFALLCNVFYAGFIFLFAVKNASNEIPNGLDLAGMSYGLTAYFPFFQMFMLYLAQKAIKRDEIKVRSSDRLR